MTRKECLDKAEACVLKDRNNQYGGCEDNFTRISRLWSVYLNRDVDEVDVAMMMGLLKIARICSNKSYADGFVDLAGYAACGAECAGIAAEEAAEFEADHKFLENIFWKYKTEANAELKYKRGDKVQYRVVLPSVSDSLWRDATYLRPAFSWQQDGEHIVSSDLGPVTVKDKDIRPAPKAEGCEELVQKEDKS